MLEVSSSGNFSSDDIEPSRKRKSENGLYQGSEQHSSRPKKKNKLNKIDSYFRKS